MIQWSVPGTSTPQKCDIYEIMARADRGDRTTSSEVIISYHYIPDDLAQAIVKEALDEKEGRLFNKLRAIDPLQFQEVVPWWQFWVTPRAITWQDYAQALGYDDRSFWLEYDGISAKVMRYISAHKPASS